MQAVNLRWYVWYSRLAATFAGMLVIGCLVSWALPEYRELGQRWGLNYVTFVVSFATLAYKLIWYRHHVKTLGEEQAMLIMSSIQAINAINLLHSTGMMESPYLILWAVIVFLAGMFGTFAVAGVFFILAMYYVLFSRDLEGHLHPTLIGTVGIVSLFIITLISYFFWKRRYVAADSQQVLKLSGQLKSKQQQSEILIQTISDGIILVNSDGKIGLINRAAAEMTEWPIEEGTGLDVQVVVKLNKEDGKELEPEANPFTIVMTQEVPDTQILQLVGRGGKQQIVSMVVSPIFGHENELEGAVAVLRDVSNSRAEEHRRADFISTASHEMRTPVAAIEGYLALALNEKVSKIDAKARSFLEKAHASTQHLGKLFQDLLTSAKAEDGRLVSHPVVIEVGSYIEQIVESLRFSAEKKGLLMDFAVGTNSTAGVGANKVIRPLYYVHADPDRMREVITNIFDNAVKYTPSGKISVGLTGNDDVVQLYIRDTGPGIPADDVPHLFQKFYRVDNSATRTIGGTGLGLFICKKIVELYHGRIWAESEVGKGSTFYINLPRLSNQKATDLQKAEAQNQTVEPVTSLTTPVV
jgi:PAS domain S-box-containing protein